ncbi:MAG: class I SAM-dependent methyltransferase [Bacillota bacterium]
MNATCKICHEPAKHAFTQKVLNKYEADYYRCPQCGFLFTYPTPWLNEAYQKPINISDTGYLSRNIGLSRRTWLLFIYLFTKDKNFLDFGGGYGVLTRLMRDYGLNYFWQDKFTSNLFAQGFERNGEPIAALTSFECFEHFDNPLEEIEKMIAICPNIFFSTELISEYSTPKTSWEYFGFSHGQHISFYSLNTLKYLAEKYNLNLYSDGTLNFITEKKINPLTFKIIMRLGVLPWDIISKLFYKGKTIEDSRMLIRTNDKEAI